LREAGSTYLREDLAPVDSWLIKLAGVIGFVKGCFHPLPSYFFTPRLIRGKKVWVTDPSIAAPGARIARHPCLGGREAYIATPDEAVFVSPYQAAKALREKCSSRICLAARELVEYIGSADELVGVTGGLAYNPRRAGDIDIVAYGPRIEEAYRVLRDLREESKTEPLQGEGHGWTSEDYELHMKIASRRLLLGYYKGVEYNVRLIYCTKPERCIPIRLLGEAEIEAHIVGGIGFSTPAIYLLRPKRVKSFTPFAAEALQRASSIRLYTFRLRYMELPIGSTILVKGEVEEHEGVPVLVPDHKGFVKILSMQ